MGRSPCCSKVGMNRGAWSASEDQLLIDFITRNGEGRWRSIPKEAGLKRCGKSCRLRWLNYLRPDIKRGNITPDEEDLIIRLHKLLGNRWSLIAGRLPGRTDNEIKNYWNTTLVKKVRGEQQHNCPEPSSILKKKEPKRAPLRRPVSKPETASKAVRTKAVRCSKVVMITPQIKNDDFAPENVGSGDYDTSPTTSSCEDYSNLPMDFSAVLAIGDPLGSGSDPDFWTMLNDWIMVDEEAAA